MRVSVQFFLLLGILFSAQKFSMFDHFVYERLKYCVACSVCEK